MLRDHILLTARDLTVAGGSVPSLDIVARAAGVSKGGLMHHFPTRDALLEGLADVALDALDAAMGDAIVSGQAAETWLRLSLPTGHDLNLFRAMMPVFNFRGPGGIALRDRLAETGQRWEAAIASEVGNGELATVIRLVGDGLALNAISGIDNDVDLTALLARLIPAESGAAQDVAPRIVSRA